MRAIKAAMLLMACSACVRDVEIATPDPAKLAACPRELPADPALTPLAGNVVVLPDGRQAVLLDLVRARSEATARYIVLLRGVARLCQSSVRYAEDWGAAAREGGK